MEKIDKKTALMILIKHSFLLTEQNKALLLREVPHLTKEKINSLGQFLADEKRASLAANEKVNIILDEFIKELDKNPKLP